jgi:hypothetical protein
MVFSGVSAFAMSYASAWCVRTTSSTTYSMVGALNKLPIAASGIVFFGDPATFANITAIFVGKQANLIYVNVWCGLLFLTIAFIFRFCGWSRLFLRKGFPTQEEHPSKHPYVII